MRFVRRGLGPRLLAAAAVILSLWPVAAEAASCRAEVGAARAALYVKECLAITSATHPPCNALNPCEVIGQHIQFMCANAGSQAPAWCRAYKTNAVPNPPPPLPRTARPGFDCTKASSPVEREICAPGNDDLATDDRHMTRLYLRLLAKSRDPARLRARQLAFLRDRELCATREPGSESAELVLDHCIEVLTHYRIDTLKRLEKGGSAWSNDDAPPSCDASFGDDGWDNITVSPGSGTVLYYWFDMRAVVLKPTDKVAFDVNGAIFPGRIKIDSDGQVNAISSDRRLIAAMAHGTMLRVRRNGKVIFRADLAGFPVSYAKARACAGMAK